MRNKDKAEAERVQQEIEAVMRGEMARTGQCPHPGCGLPTDYGRCANGHG